MVKPGVVWVPQAAAWTLSSVRFHVVADDVSDAVFAAVAGPVCELQAQHNAETGETYRAGIERASSIRASICLQARHDVAERYWTEFLKTLDAVRIPEAREVRPRVRSLRWL